MLRYSELYRIGILQIFLEDEEFSRLLNAKRNSDLPKLGSDTTRIEERVPAPYDFVPPRYQLEFLKRIGVDSVAKLHGFGAAPEKGLSSR